MNEYVLEARSLVKRQQGKFLLNGIHVHAKRGECLAFIGDDLEANQALIEVLSTMDHFSAGDLFINGLNTKYDLKRTKKIISVMSPVFDNELSVLQNLSIYCQLYDIPKLDLEKRITEYMRIYDLEEYADYSPDTLSAFNQFKLCYIRTKVIQPEIVFWNENLSQFNDLELQEAFELIADIKKDATLIMASRSPVYTYKFADQIAVLSEGKVHEYGSVKENLLGQVGNEVVEFSYSEDEIDYLMQRISKDMDFYMLDEKLYLFLKPGQDSKNIIDMIHSDEIIIRKPDVRDLLIRHKAKAVEA